MELVELMGNQAEVASEAVELIENSLHPDSTWRETLDDIRFDDKLRLIRGLCGILTMWSYAKYYQDSDENVEAKLIGFIRESVEWEADKGRPHLHVKYLALNLLEASTGEEQEFYRRLGLLEQDKNGSLVIRSRTIERVILELVNWFRYYSWDGYGKTGPQNCQDALEVLKRDIVYLRENGTPRRLS